MNASIIENENESQIILYIIRIRLSVKKITNSKERSKQQNDRNSYN